MTKDEALKLALEALQNPWKAGPDGVADAIIAIKEVLAQPEQEPFMASYEFKQYGYYKDGKGTLKLGNIPATQPPQRTWVTLTEDEVALIVADCSLVTPSDFYFYKAIEAKLKAKNT